jgi:integrase
MGLRGKERTRHFDFLEIRAYCAAAAATPYPYGPCLRVLIETGQRIGEVANARWSQIDLEGKLWTIPGGKFKPEDDHIVPLSENMVEMFKLLRSEQPADHGDFVFSSSNGQRPITNFSRQKAAFHEKFLGELRKIAPERVLRNWRWHDVRRTVRTQLEPIVGRREVAEAAIGHSKTGIERIYNLYGYRREIRQAFNVWSEMLGKMERGTLTFDEWER